MFADLSHSTASSFAGRLSLLVWRLSRAFEAPASQHLPPEISRLSDHQLRDIGLEPHLVRPAFEQGETSLELLQRESR